MSNQLEAEEVLLKQWIWNKANGLSHYIQNEILKIMVHSTVH